MNEFIDVVHQTAQNGFRLKEAKDILWFLASDWSFLVGIYFILFVFVFFLIRNCMLCAPFILCYVHAELRHCTEQVIIIIIWMVNKSQSIKTDITSISGSLILSWQGPHINKSRRIFTSRLILCISVHFITVTFSYFSQVTISAIHFFSNNHNTLSIL